MEKMKVFKDGKIQNIDKQEQGKNCEKIGKTKRKNKIKPKK
jgi:hypothetical protein